MKKLIIITSLLCLAGSINAQTIGEWLNQKATQKKYLLQQIAALQVYIGYVSKGYSIAKKGLNTIQDIKHGDLNLHSAYFASLAAVNPKIKRYSRVADIISLEISIAKQASKTIKDCKNICQLTQLEIDYLQQVITNLLADCSNCLDALYTLITNSQLTMKDDERIAAIDKLYADMVDKEIFIQAFTNSTMGLCVQRANDQRDIIVSQKLNGLK